MINLLTINTALAHFYYYTDGSVMTKVSLLSRGTTNSEARESGPIYLALPSLLQYDIRLTLAFCFLGSKYGKKEINVS